jgi:hypothetical protein
MQAGDSHAWFRHGLDCEGQLQLFDLIEYQVAHMRSCPEVLRRRHEGFETLRQNGALDDSLDRLLLQCLDPTNLPERSTRLREYLDRVGVVTTDRCDNFIRRRSLRLVHGAGTPP